MLVRQPLVLDKEGPKITVDINTFFLDISWFFLTIPHLCSICIYMHFVDTFENTILLQKNALSMSQHFFLKKGIKSRKNFKS